MKCDASVDYRASLPTHKQTNIHCLNGSTRCALVYNERAMCSGLDAQTCGVIMHS